MTVHWCNWENSIEKRKENFWIEVSNSQATEKVKVNSMSSSGRHAGRKAGRRAGRPVLSAHPERNAERLQSQRAEWGESQEARRPNVRVTLFSTKRHANLKRNWEFHYLYTLARDRASLPWPLRGQWRWQSKQIPRISYSVGW